MPKPCSSESAFLSLAKGGHGVRAARWCEWLSVIALRARETILKRNRALVNGNAAKLTAFFEEFPDLFDWQQPDGGCVGFPAYIGSGSTDIGGNPATGDLRRYRGAA